MGRIVKLKPNNIAPDFTEITVEHIDDVLETAREFISNDLTTFWGTWENNRVMLWCDDLGMQKRLMPNKLATLAYLGQCIPGTMHVILGNAIAVLDKEDW